MPQIAQAILIRDNYILAKRNHRAGEYWEASQVLVSDPGFPVVTNVSVQRELEFLSYLYITYSWQSSLFSRSERNGEDSR